MLLHIWSKFNAYYNKHVHFLRHFIYLKKFLTTKWGVIPQLTSIYNLFITAKKHLREHSEMRLPRFGDSLTSPPHVKFKWHLLGLSKCYVSVNSLLQFAWRLLWMFSCIKWALNQNHHILEVFNVFNHKRSYSVSDSALKYGVLRS